jgi:hypothetical protein
VSHAIKKYFSSTLYSATFLFISLGLLIHYRGNAGDIDLYTQAGGKILAGENPYLNSEYANSPLGAVIIKLLSLLFPESFFPLVIQGLNIMGVLIFVQLLRKYEARVNFLGIAILGLALSTPYRALIADVQVSGTILGLFSLALILKDHKFPLVHFCAFLMIALCVEIKPQVGLPFALIFWYRYWNRLYFFGAMALFLLGHLLVSFQFGSVLEFLWFEKLAKFSAKSLLPGPEISVWKLLNHLTDQESAIRIIGMCSVILYYLILISLRNKPDSFLLFFATAAPLVTSYSHMYDLVALVLIIAFSEHIVSSAKIPALLLLVIPPGTEPRVLLAIIGMTLIAFCILSLVTIASDFRIATFLIACVFLVLFLARHYSTGDIELELSTRLVVLIPLLVFGMLRIDRPQGSTDSSWRSRRAR